MLSTKFLQSTPRFQCKGLSVRGIGIHETMPPSIIERYDGTGDYLIMLFHDEVQFGPPQSRRKLEGPTLAMWPHGAAHFYGNTERRWTHSWIHCDGPLVAKYLADAGVKGERLVRMRNPAAIDKYLVAMNEEINGSDSPDRIILQNLLENLIREAARGDRASRRIAIPAPLTRARARIDTHYEQKLTLTALAREAGLSANHFCSEFTRHFGAAPMTYLIHRRLQAAAALLRGTNEPVGEIGRRVGYADPYYFSKHFKACFGVPPSALRSHRP